MSKEIRLIGSVQTAKVDDEDFEWLNKFVWSAYNGYAVTKIAGQTVEMGTLVYLMHEKVIPMTENLLDSVKGRSN